MSEVEHTHDRCTVRVSSQFQVERAVMAENSRRFVSAYRSPLLRRDWLEKLGLKGKSEDSKAVVNEGVIPAEADLQQREFLKLLFQPHKCKVNHQISTQEWNGHWIGNKEQTSSSKSGLHYGQHKVQCQSATLSEVKCKLATLAVRNATLLDRWRNGVSITLVKLAGDVHLSKLRAILLLEADFNALNKMHCLMEELCLRLKLLMMFPLK